MLASFFLPSPLLSLSLICSTPARVHCFFYLMSKHALSHTCSKLCPLFKSLPAYLTQGRGEGEET